MRIPKYIQSKIASSDNPLRQFLVAVRDGDVVGTENEFAEYIQPRITDPIEIERVYESGHEYTNLMGELFRPRSGESFFRDPDLYGATSSIRACFRVLFRLNPLAIVKSDAFTGHDGTKKWSISAIYGIGNLPVFKDELRPEITGFITDHYSQLNEQDMRKIMQVFHGDEVMTRLVRDLFTKGMFSSEQFTRNTIPANDLKQKVKKHWQPDHKNKVDFFYNGFPREELWRLFMDGYQQKQGWREYEAREPGCINQLYHAWLYVKKTVNEPLTTDYFKDIHAICAKGILRGMNNQPGEYRDSTNRFVVYMDTMTFHGYLEHISHFENICNLYKVPEYCFHSGSKTETDELDSTINGFIKEYEANTLAHANEPEALMADIILFCKKLLLIHPFPDCNGRLFCNLILNRELIRNGFPPTLLDNPNRIDGYSTNEAMSEVIRGMDFFQDVKNRKLPSGFLPTSELKKTMKYPLRIYPQSTYRDGYASNSIFALAPNPPASVTVGSSLGSGGHLPNNIT